MGHMTYYIYTHINFIYIMNSILYAVHVVYNRM